MNSPFWSAFVNSIVPYIPGEQPKISNIIKLNTNENAYGVSPNVSNALKQAIGDNLKLYPDPTAGQLRQELGCLHKVNEDCIFIGNGSDEVLGFAFHALLKHNKPVLFPDITYSFYPVYCRLFDISFHCIPLNDSFEINLQDYQNHEACGIVITNPNAPTGILLKSNSIANYLDTHPHQLVIVDEAYIDFGGETVIPFVKKYPNLLVVRTFSKFYSLAGLRVGYAVGQPDLIEGIVRVKDSFNSYPLDYMAQIGAVAAVKDIQWSINNARSIIKNRKNLIDALNQLGFQTLDSKANFIFTSHPLHEGKKIANYLRDNKILIRHFDSPRIKNWLRITIGNAEECKRLIEALAQMN